MYTVSDAIETHCRAPLDSPERFGDVIQRHELKADGTWSAGVNVVDRSTLPAHPPKFIGHLASPSVARVGGRYYMAFAASVDDPNLCAAEHAAANICGSCVDPWSYFVVMWAVSDDGVTWRVRERSPGDATLISATPVRDTNFKGITRVTLVPRQEPSGRTYFYIGAQYWGTQTTKMLMMRIPYDATSEWGISGDPELWSRNRTGWLPCPRGVIPAIMNSPGEHSVPLVLELVSAISRTTIRGASEYIALSVSSSRAFPGYQGVANEISYAFSSNLIDWDFPTVMRTTIPYFADGWSYDASVIDPVAVDDHGALRLFFASADGDEAFGIPRDGQHDCGTRNGFGATAPYVGTGIYESRVEMITPRRTGMTLSVDRMSIEAGEPIRCRVDVTDDSGQPVEGVVTFHAELLTRRARLSGGHAEAELTFLDAGTRAVEAEFQNQGLWQSSGRRIDGVQVAPNTLPSRRRAVRR